MRFTAFIERTLGTKRGEFWLAWSISLLLGMFWVIPVSLSSPGILQHPNQAVVAIGGTVFMVALFAAVAILLIARPLEKRFARRNMRALPAALAYLLVLFGVGFAFAALGFAAGYKTGIWGMIIGMALMVSSPVAFVGRLLYPKLKTSLQTAAAVLILASLLGTFGLASLLLQPLLR